MCSPDASIADARPTAEQAEHRRDEECRAEHESSKDKTCAPSACEAGRKEENRRDRHPQHAQSDRGRTYPLGMKRAYCTERRIGESHAELIEDECAAECRSEAERGGSDPQDSPRDQVGRRLILLGLRHVNLLLTARPWIFTAGP
jgi:hypothetical protein